MLHMLFFHPCFDLEVECISPKSSQSAASPLNILKPFDMGCIICLKIRTGSDAFGGNAKQISATGVEQIEPKNGGIYHDRIKWAQRGICVFSLIGLFFFFLGRSTRSPILQAIALVFAGMTAVSIGNLCYKNVSLVVMKRLLIEANVIIIVLLGLYNLAIEIVRPDDFLSTFGYQDI